MYIGKSSFNHMAYTVFMYSSLWTEKKRDRARKRQASFYSKQTYIQMIS